MFKIIEIEDSRWDSIVNSYAQRDIYYFRGYCRGFQLHGDGIPLLMSYETSELRGICVVFRREIPGQTELFDIITPYGYGGFIWEGDTGGKNMLHFSDIFREEMKKSSIVSGFFRYHPLLNNADHVRSVFPTIDLGKTIHIDLESEEKIFENLSSKNRNTIRKAEKNGVSICYGKGMELFDIFIPIYNSTMDRDEASNYYYFKPSFYESIDSQLKDNYLIFYAQHEGKIISMAIILFENQLIHYHLSGSLSEYRHLAPSNLLLYEVALWGVRNGFKEFHLGGGVGSGEDSLFKFKKAFNRNSENRFSIGKLIFNQEKYDTLVAERSKQNSDFDVNSHFFPLYRA